MKRISFTAPQVAELVDAEERPVGAGLVRVKMLYTAVSAGTERANILGKESVSAFDASVQTTYPRTLGYSGSGIVEEVGEGVTEFKPGDRVITYWSCHQQYNTLGARQIVKIPDGVDMKDAAFAFITTFPLAAIRKIRLELGESCMVVGLGLLGLYAVQYAHLSGAMPVIAVDFNPERRALALQLGADYAFDPADPDMNAKIKAITGGKGANGVVEVTGNGAALTQALHATAPFGRVALLGCTRTPATVDFYHDVHSCGIQLIGAHTMARPQEESHPGYWTHNDDCRTALDYIAAGRLNVKPMIAETHSPADAPEVYTRLCNDPKFPIGVVFDWSLVD